ncbi:MAG: alpha/beta fold hydrolase [Bacillota bacterium]
MHYRKLRDKRGTPCAGNMMVVMKERLMKQQKLVYQSGSLNLEGRLAIPSRAGAAAGVVLCHPHPLFGGTMNNNVISAVSRALVEKGIATLCFNFRGVGQSEGSYDNGRGEADDARAAVSFLAGREEIDSSRLGLAGYSFGGAIALLAGMEDDTVKAVAAVSPAGLPEFGRAKPRLVVCGTWDSQIPVSKILQEEERISGGGAGTVEIVEGADHFWRGYEAVLADLVVTFFLRHLVNSAATPNRPN